MKLLNDKHGLRAQKCVNAQFLRCLVLAIVLYLPSLLLRAQCPDFTNLNGSISSPPEVTIQSTTDTICRGASATLSASVSSSGSGSSGTATPPAVAIGDENGLANTNAIRNKYGSNFSNCQAAYNCYYYNHSTGTAGSTHLGWYLPAARQLLKLYAQQATISAVLAANGGSEISRTNHYWSSTYATNTNGYYLHNPQGYWSTTSITVSPNTTTTYQVIATNESWCSSTTSFTLHVNNADTVFVADNVCQGQPYTDHGFNIPADSTMIPHVIVETQNFASLRTGCDSITILTLTINPVDTVRLYETVCEGEPYSGYGFNIPSSSTINRRVVVKTSHTTSQQTGCDSCTILTLTITPFPEVTIQSTEDTICNGTSATLSASAITSIPAMLPEISVGDILCTDSSIVKPTDWPVPGKIAMGIVFFVDTSEQHGWAVALKESSYAAWDINTPPNDVPGISNFTTANNAITDLNGQANTLAIKNMSANNFSNNEAAYRCYYFDHIIGSVGSIHKGWYLPAAGQLGILYSALPIINNTINILGTAAQPFSDMSYWTSTEFSYYYAWNLIYNGAVYLYYKNSNNAAVRPCRTF